jgi:hypothetical protein
MKILIGTPIHPQGAYALDKFLANQKEIQKEYPACELLFSSIDSSYVDELKGIIKRWGLKGTAIHYSVEKPAYARSRLWNIACGREVIRQYFLTQTDASALLFLDADMTFDPAVVSIMEKESKGYAAVFSGYGLRDGGVGLAGAGCLLLTREAAQKIKIRCYEFKNGDTIFEDNLIEMDLYRAGGRIKKGIFLSIDHYASSSGVRHISPQKVSPLRQLINHPLLRCILIRTSILFQRNIPWRLFSISAKLQKKT